MSMFHSVLRRSAFQVPLIGVLAMVGSFCISRFVYEPVPSVHDEFCYLLAADTFAHGKLTNPPHPLWQHFESYHVLHEPTYMSKFPPGQGFLLAIGMVLNGDPKLGLWLGSGLMCAAIHWMLLGWVPPRWALLGGMLTVLQYGIFTYWTQTFWGGAVAATGGALVFGGIRRLLRHAHPGHGLVVGIGLAILANSRPLEGLIVSLPCLILLGRWIWDQRKTTPLFYLVSRLSPLALCLALTLGWMGYYNWRVTGSAVIFPHVKYHQTYFSVPPLLFLPLQPPIAYQNPTLENYFALEAKAFQARQSWGTYWKIKRNEFILLWRFFFGIPFSLCLPLFPLVLRRRKMRWVGALCAVMWLFMFLTTWAFPHYIAPITSLMVLLVVESLRQASLWRSGTLFSGRLLVPAVLMCCLLSLGIQVFAPWLMQMIPEFGRMPEAIRTWKEERAALKTRLETTPGEHLVLVTYDQSHFPGQEWVYNQASIDEAKIVWARALDDVSNCRLRRYFRQRTQWTLTFRDDHSPVLKRLEASPCPEEK